MCDNKKYSILGFSQFLLLNLFLFSKYTHLLYPTHDRNTELSSFSFGIGQVTLSPPDLDSFCTFLNEVESSKMIGRTICDCSTIAESEHHNGPFEGLYVSICTTNIYSMDHLQQ